MNRSALTALLGSAIAHATVLSFWSASAPLTPPEIPLASHVEAILLHEVQNAGETTHESSPSAGSMPATLEAELRKEIEQLTRTTAMLEAQLAKMSQQKAADERQYAAKIESLRSDRVTAERAAHDLAFELSGSLIRNQSLTKANAQLAVDLEHSENAARRAEDQLRINDGLILSLENTIVEARIERTRLMKSQQGLTEEVESWVVKNSAAQSENQSLRMTVTKQAVALADARTEKEQLRSHVETLTHQTAQLEMDIAALEDLREAQAQAASASQASAATGNAIADVQPLPVAGNPKPVYPRLAIKQGIEGDVALNVRVSESGHVAQVSIMSPSGSTLLDNAAVESVRTWRFTPAYRDGRPSETVTTVPIQFRLVDARG